MFSIYYSGKCSLSILLVINLKLPCKDTDAYFSNFNQTFTFFSDNKKILE